MCGEHAAGRLLAPGPRLRRYSANLWLHQHDFRGPNTHGCDLSDAMENLEVKTAQDLEEQAKLEL